jgi:hypothetical protein
MASSFPVAEQVQAEKVLMLFGLLDVAVIER